MENFSNNEKVYLKKFINKLTEAKKCFTSEETQYWIKSFTDTVHANCFYIESVCKNDKTNYYRRYYRTKRKIVPHTIIYINLGCGYPKELRFGHYAYVYKVENGKALVIPLVSIKNTKRKLRKQEIKIVLVNHGMLTTSIMRFDEMRWIDLQRINESHDIPEKVQTSRDTIETALTSYLEIKY